MELKRRHGGAEMTTNDKPLDEIPAAACEPSEIATGDIKSLAIVTNLVNDFSISILSTEHARSCANLAGCLLKFSFT